MALKGNVNWNILWKITSFLFSTWATPLLWDFTRFELLGGFRPGKKTMENGRKRVKEGMFYQNHRKFGLGGTLEISFQPPASQGVFHQAQVKLEKSIPQWGLQGLEAMETKQGEKGPGLSPALCALGFGKGNFRKFSTTGAELGNSSLEVPMKGKSARISPDISRQDINSFFYFPVTLQKCPRGNVVIPVLSWG